MITDDNWNFICYTHNYRNDYAPCREEHAYEGDREYFNAKIAKLEARIQALEANMAFVKAMSEVLMHSRLSEGSKTKIPTFDTCSCGDDLCGLVREQITQKGKNGK